MFWSVCYGEANTSHLCFGVFVMEKLILLIYVQSVRLEEANVWSTNSFIYVLNKLVSESLVWKHLCSKH